MTIEEYKNGKRQLESDIAAAVGDKISEYERETGLSVEGIGIDIHRTFLNGGYNWEKRLNVSVDVPI